ncbi:hypothetical protein [Chroococcidiopsis sp. TS-821]
MLRNSSSCSGGAIAFTPPHALCDLSNQRSV